MTELETPYKKEISASIDYLRSPEAWASIRNDPYWPKWNSPWWHIQLLHEMGLHDQIPVEAAGLLLHQARDQFVDAFLPSELPRGTNATHDLACFCQMGTLYLALDRCGLDVDSALPWARSFMIRYELPGGGLNCGDDHYKHAKPGTSIVASVAVLEAFALSKAGPKTDAERRFLDRGMAELWRRKLRFAFAHTSNAEEKEDEADWLKLTFPRFYFYDILRGLNLAVRYADRFQQPISKKELGILTGVLKEKASDGELRVERQAFDWPGTWVKVSQNKWDRIPKATRFPLLDAAGTIGAASPYLTRQWQECLALIEKLDQAGLLLD